MKIQALGELLIELLGRNSQDFIVDIRVALGAAQTAYGTLVEQKIKNGEPVTSFYRASVFNVLTDTTRNEKYIAPFPKVMNIGDNDGIAQIGHVRNRYDTFVLQKPSQLGQYSLLEAGQMFGQVGARPEGDIIYFDNLPETTTQVLLKYIPQLLDMNEDDEAFGSSDLDDMVINMTLQKFGIKLQKGEDKNTDDNSN